MADKNRPYAQVLEEEHLRGGLSATTSYVYGDALISAATEGSTHYYHTDGLGSVRGLSDASGALTDSYTYKAYGLPTTSSGATVNPYRYCGEQYDAALNASYLRARYYQPGVGRFLTMDSFEGVPIEPMSLHRYMYANDNPDNYFDPSGRMSLAETIVTTGIVLNLAAMPIGAFTEIGQNIFATFAENVFPEAYIVGINGSVTVPPPFSWMIDQVFSNSPIPVPILYYW